MDIRLIPADPRSGMVNPQAGHHQEWLPGLDPVDAFAVPPARSPQGLASADELRAELEAFREFGRATECGILEGDGVDGVPVFVNEFWTAKQRAAHRLHEVSYRACFKPQLPRFFIERLTRPGDLVYDPFMGRGTTLIEAALCGRAAAGCDINPLSAILCRPRLDPPAQTEVEARLASLDLVPRGPLREELLVFYHPETLAGIAALAEYLASRRESGEEDRVDRWIRMVATNRLTGHSPGFFSVYTLPPNQAVSVKSQHRINEKRSQSPPRRDVRRLIARKSRSLLGSGGMPRNTARLLTGSAAATPELADQSVHLVVTSPPFLDVVDYRTDNWLRCWFNGIDAESIAIWQIRSPEAWQMAMESVMRELARVLAPGAWVAFEVGEVRSGRLPLETLALPAGRAAGLSPEAVLINSQKFTKTSNCWGVDNLAKGTNSNRIVLFSKG